MKKIAVLCLILMSALAVKAQVYVGGAVGFWHNDDLDATSFEISPEVGYNINENWAIGATLGFAHEKVSKEGIKVKANAFAFAPYARFTFFESKVVRLFIDGGMCVSTYKMKGFDSESGFEIGLKPGISLKLSEHFNFVTKYGFLGYRDEYLGKGSDGYGFALSSEDLTIGFHYEF